MILDRLSRALAGAGQIVTIQGEAGIGKTALVERSLGDVEGAVLLTAAADEMERERPFGLIAEALGLSRNSADDERRRLGRLLTGEDVGQIGGVSALRLRLVEEIVGMLERMSSVAPIVLMLDDLHWADAGTIATIRQIARALSHLPLLLVATLRPSPRSADLTALLRSLAAAGAAQVSLAPLGDADLNALASKLVLASPDASLLKELGRAGGNPFFVTEIVAALVRAEAIVVEEGTARTTAEYVPADVADAVLRRMTAVTDNTTRVLQIASVLGSTFTASDLVTVAGIEVGDLADHVAEGMRCGVLDESGDRLGFRHDVVREAIYLAIPVSVRKAFHMKAAYAFASAGAQIERIAAHVSIGAEQGDLQAVEWLREAARSPLLAPSVAVEMLRRALAVAGADGTIGEMLTAELLVMLSWAGRHAEAKRMAEDLLRRTNDPAVAARVRMALAQILMLDARYEESIAALDSALLDVREPVVQAALLGNLAIARSITGKTDGGDYGHRAIEAGRASGNDAAVGVGYAALGQEAWKDGDIAELRRVWQEAREERRGGVLASDWSLGSVVVPSMGLYLAEADLTVECEQEIATARQEAERRGTEWANYYGLIMMVRTQFITGEWDDAAAEAEAGLLFAEENDIRYGWLVLRPVMAAIAVHRGDIDTAEAVLPTEQELADRGPNIFAALARLGSALVLEAKGRLDEAIEVAGRAEGMFPGVYHLAYLSVAGEYVRLCLAGGRVEDARARLDSIERVSARIGNASSRGFALRARGLVDKDPALLARAVEEFRRSPRVPELATACEDAGFAAASTPEGAELIEESLGLYERLGATRDVARVEAKLRAAGIRRGARGRRGRPSSGWDSLTPTELRIVSLVADGLSNPDVATRLFVSRNTVQTHLAHVFSKLGVRTRLELAVLASRHSLSTTPEDH